MKLYIYTHKFGKYPTFYACAPDRNTANALLTVWADTLSEYDRRNCDFSCEEISTDGNFDWVDWEEDCNDLITKAIEIQNRA